MAKKERTCKNCMRLVQGNECPACKTSDLTKNWKGMAIIVDPDSKIGEVMGIETPGKYAVKMR